MANFNRSSSYGDRESSFDSDETEVFTVEEWTRICFPEKSNNNMASEGGDMPAAAPEAHIAAASISWHDPHPVFVIVLVGADEIPFGIQKDLLIAQSPYFKQLFDSAEQQIEHITKLPDTTKDAFGCFQNFLYTRAVYDKQGGMPIPDYQLLMAVWKLATKLQMAEFRTAVLETMDERRITTGNIPGSPILIQAWEETEEGSGLRKMLIGWAAMHMRNSPALRNEFAKSLPHEILAELVVIMSDESIPSIPTVVTTPPTHHAKHARSNSASGHGATVKKSRKSDTGRKTSIDDSYDAKPPKKASRKSEPFRRPPVIPQNVNVTTEQDLEDCRLLISRMLTAPSYWTRYIKSFREPVDPVRDNCPNYFDVVKRPMDLSTIHRKMANNQYASGGEFEADVRLIFQNCYEYWTNDDPVFKECELFENFFNRQFALRHAKKGEGKIKPELLE